MADYQSAGALSWTTGQAADIVRRVHDKRYGAQILRVDFADVPPALRGTRSDAGTTDTLSATAASAHAGPDTGNTIVVVRQVATRTRAALPFAPLTAAERQFWTEPTPSAPTDGLVRGTARRITASHTSDQAKLRALYDWVIDTTYRRAETPGCGTGDYASMLQSGAFGGKCADINSLLVGLARSIGLPARDVYGIRVAPSRLAPSLGREGDVSKAQHCRAEVFLDEEGWFPVDPADVRKVILEQELSMNSDDVLAIREQLFGDWEMNWIGYNSATDIELPDAGDRRPNFAFLMYPCAFACWPAGLPQPGAVPLRDQLPANKRITAMKRGWSFLIKQLRRPNTGGPKFNVQQARLGSAQTRQGRAAPGPALLKYWIPKASLWRSLRQSLNLACFIAYFKEPLVQPIPLTTRCSTPARCPWRRRADARQATDARRRSCPPRPRR